MSPLCPGAATATGIAAAGLTGTTIGVVATIEAPVGAAIAIGYATKSAWDWLWD